MRNLYWTSIKRMLDYNKTLIFQSQCPCDFNFFFREKYPCSLLFTVLQIYLIAVSKTVENMYTAYVITSINTCWFLDNETEHVIKSN